ncbi:MAG TPA: arsenate reductase (glutaredoxin) [Nitrospira sp.]|jgi:arsenate reductase|nr:arsenate reductase (glutaredoxin) [Nitrospira sp.]MCC7472522.1 arsenate reductase (glutaredoxin) [Candidatus Nomurabacteria bacterium]MBS0158306.1 arsenate reductase (glutaredoxin) [Nitrospira sp.]MBS0178472.1 arsenate reductase (glutaredoxin) [Nitrospira sp.]HNI69065.1 arsenate reductase (glutaredoxin) [Nitrospira sp.]
MAEITIYQKPTCSTCREAVRLVRESGQPFTAINYYEKPFTKSQLQALLKKAGLSARDILRTKEDLYKSLKLSDPALSQDQLLDHMVAHPDLIQRPIVEKGDTVMLARPAETVSKLL